MGNYTLSSTNPRRRRAVSCFSILALTAHLALMVGLAGIAEAAAPTAPTNLAATMASSRQINLSWTDNATTETNYYVERSPNGTSSWTVVATLAANITSYQNTGLTQNTRYYYRVRCKAGTTYSSYSATANATTATLAAPTALLASAASSTRITLNWTDNTAYETQYSIERSPNGTSSWTVLGTVATNVTTTTNGGLTAGTTYYYRVRAYDSTNYSAYSNTANATTATVAAPAAPTALTASMLASNKIALSWTDNSSDETQFSVERSPNGTSSWTAIGTVASNVTTSTNSGLTAGTAYYYRVRAYNGTLYSAYSNTANATTATLAAPTALTTTVAAATQITLNWTDNTTYETQYALERSPTGTDPWTAIGSVATNVTTTTNSGLAAGTAYYYRVRAYDSTNYSAYSNTANQTIRTITASAGSNGTINPSGTVGVANGGTKAFTMTPNSGYKIATVTVNGGAVATTPTYTFTSVTSNQTISTTFSVNSFTIAASAGPNGAISPSGAVVVNGGASTTFTFLPNTGYRISDVQVDGASVGSPLSYVFPNVSAAHSIFVNFAVIDTEPPLHVTMPKISKISAGYNNSMAVATDGSLWTWGDAFLGDGAATQNNSPQLIGTDHTWSFIAAGSNFTMALRSDSTLWAWGSNWLNWLGDGTNVDRFSPIRIGTANDWKSVSTRGQHTVAIKQNGTLWAWGDNESGQLGNGTTTDRQTPTQIGTATNWAAVSAGAYHTIALKTNGTLWAWGANWYGQLGDGTTTDRYSPVQIGTATDWSMISAGAYHTAALKSGNTLWAWGINSYGQVGDGSTIDKYSPTRIGTGADWSAVSAGGYHSVARKSNGTLWSWGANWSGQLGDGTVTDRYVPVPIGAASDWAAITAGDAHTLATSSTGTLWTWGSNLYGQLGDGTTQDRAVPQSIVNVIGANNAITITTTDPYMSSPFATSRSVTLKLHAWDAASGVAFMKFSNDGSTWTTPEPYMASKAWQLLMGDGQKTVYAMFQDAAGNWSAVFSASVLLDTTPPVVSIQSPAAGSIVSSTPLLLFSVDDGWVTVKVDGNIIYRKSGDLYPTPLSDGSHVIRVESFDDAGNVGFAESTFTVDTAAVITATSTAHGTIFPSGAVSVPYGMSQTFTISPDSGYHIVDVLVDGTSVGAVSSYTFLSITADHTITASYSNAYTITGTATAHGTISPAGAVSIPYGTDKTFSISPESGYHITDVLVDGASVGAVSTYTFRNIIADHTITANYSNTYTITATATANGTISPAGAVSILNGTDRTYTITPNAGYHLRYVLVDGISVGVVNSYQFQQVTANHTIVAGFSSDSEISILQGVGISSNAIDSSLQESTAIFYYVDKAAVVTLKIIPEKQGSGGSPVYQSSQVCSTAGAYVFTWDGHDSSGNVVPDEAYLFILEAADGVSTAVYNPAVPTGAGSISCSQGADYDPYRNDALAINYSLPQPARVDISIGWPGSLFKVMDAVPHASGKYTFNWDGRSMDGRMLGGGGLAQCTLASRLGGNAIITTGRAPKVTLIKTDPYEITLSYGELTRITYTLSRNATVTIKLIPTIGTAIALLDSQAQTAGPHEIQWDGFDRTDVTGTKLLMSQEGDFTVFVEAADPLTGAKSNAKGALRVWR